MSTYQQLAEELAASGIDVEWVKAKLKTQHIETPSWGYGNSGTRFKTFAYPGAARDVHEKLADAGMVNKLTGVCPTVALHIPWDKVNDWEELRQEAADNWAWAWAPSTPTRSRPTSTSSAASATPTRPCASTAVEHHLECVEIAKILGSNGLSLWYADGTNYAGQDSLAGRSAAAWSTSLSEVYAALPPSMRHADRVQVLRAGVLSHRPERLGRGLQRGAEARPAGAGAGRHRATTRRARTSSTSSPRCSTRASWAASISTPASTATTI